MASIDVTGMESPSLRAKARDYLDALVRDRIVHIRGYGLDSEDRLLGMIFCEEQNINLEMVRAGLARVDPRTAPGNLDLESFWKAQAEARRAGRGFWSKGMK